MTEICDLLVFEKISSTWLVLHAQKINLDDRAFLVSSFVFANATSTMFNRISMILVKCIESKADQRSLTVANNINVTMQA